MAHEQHPPIDAWVYTGPYPDGLLQTQIFLPSIEKGQDRALVEIQTCALNPVDIQTMNLPRKANEKGKEWGTVCDFSGILLNDFSDLQKGQEVFGMTVSPNTPLRIGSLAKMAVTDAKTTVMIKKPLDWTHEQACAIPLVWLTAKRCIEDVKPFIEKREKRVVVLGGSSAVGMYTIILAKRNGWRVLATSSSNNKEFLENQLKIDQHVDYTNENVRQSVTSFQPDAIIDCVGGKDCIGIKGNARYISIVGDKTGRETMGGPYTYYDYRSPINALTQWIRWAKGYVGLGESYDVVILNLKKDWLEEATKTIDTNTIFIDSTFDFKDAKQAFERLNTGRAKGKVVIRVA